MGDYEFNSWVPVNKLVQGKLSPQSGMVLELLRQKYGTGDANETRQEAEDRAWNAGWRWHMLESNHMWYPPKFEKEEGDGDGLNDKIDAYNALVERYSRGKPGTKFKGSLPSGKGGSKIAEIIEAIDEIEEMI